MTTALPERIERRIERTLDGCWLWVGRLGDDGYGRIDMGPRPYKPKVAHKVVYELLVGPVPDGLQLDHLCRVRHCVRPGHLEPVTCRVNLLRGETITAANAAVTHCPQGHPYDDENTYVHNGQRKCRICRRASRLASQRRKAARLKDSMQS